MTPKRLYGAYIFDLDGTVLLGETLLPTAAETIRSLRRLGRRTIFLSNNPTRNRATYAELLTECGVPTPPEDIINSSLVMIDFLNAELPDARLFVVGEEPLQEDLRAAGFRLVEDPGNTDAVIASFDRTFTYRKLQIAFDAIRAGARFFATHADRYRPVPGGGQPDAAAFIAAIESCTGARCEAIVGKPSIHTIRSVLKLVGLPAHECVMTGDRLETDVRMALDAGMAAALTLTGATSAEMVASSKIKPTYLLNALGDLLPRDAGQPAPRQ